MPADGANPSRLSPSDALEHLVSSADAMLTVDRSGKIRWANSAAASLFGYELDDFVALTVSDLIPEEQRERHHEFHRAYVDSPRPRFMQASPRSLLGLRQNGSTFSAEISLGGIGDVEESSVMAIVRDVDAQRLRESNEEFIRLSLDSVAEAVFLFETDTLKVRYVNEAGCQQLGVSRSSLLDGVAFDELELNPKSRNRSLREVIAPLIGGDRTAVTYDAHRQHHELGHRHLEVLVQRYDGEIGQDCLVALVRDTTERSAQHRRIEESEKLLRALAEIRLAVLSASSSEHVLSTVAQAVLSAMDASYVRIVMPNASGKLVISAMAGRVGRDTIGLEVGSSQPEAQVYAEGRTIHVDGSAALANLRRRRLGDEPSVLGAQILSPLLTDGSVLGVLVVGRKAGSPNDDPHAFRIADALSSESAVAIQLQRSRTQQERLRLMEDRDRIGRELQDSVIQRLFAAGMKLQAAGSDSARLAEVSNDVIVEIDGCIALIRDTVFNVASRLPD